MVLGSLSQSKSPKFTTSHKPCPIGVYGYNYITATSYLKPGSYSTSCECFVRSEFACVTMTRTACTDDCIYICTIFALHLQEASTGLYSVGTPWQDTWKQFRSDHNLFKDATTLNLLHDFWEPKLTTEQIHFLPKESITVACSNSHLIWTLTFFITNKTSLLTDQLSIKTVLSIQNTPNCLHNSQITLTPAIKL